MKLSYFCSYPIEGADAGDPSSAVRAKTRREVEDFLDVYAGREGMGKVFRCEIEYRDSFDLLFKCLYTHSTGPEWEEVPRTTREPA